MGRLWVKAAKCIAFIAHDVSSGQYMKVGQDAKDFLDSCQESNRDAFESAMQESHLLSEESDAIIRLLRKHKFEDVHYYNPDTCEWEYDPNLKPSSTNGNDEFCHCCIVCWAFRELLVVHALSSYSRAGRRPFYRFKV